MCQKMYNLLMTVQSAAHPCSCSLTLFKCQPESTSQHCQACFCLEWLSWCIVCKTSQMTLKKNWQTGSNVISVTQDSDTWLIHASVPPLKTTKMKSVKDNEGGVNNDHVSYNTQDCDASSCRVWLKNHILSSPDRWSKMVPGYVLHITTKLGSKKKRVE